LISAARGFTPSRLAMSNACRYHVSNANAYMESGTQGWLWCPANGVHRTPSRSKLRSSCEELHADTQGIEPDEKCYMTQVSGCSTRSGASSPSLEELPSPGLSAEIDDITLQAMDTCILEEIIQTVAAECKFCVTIADPKKPDLPLIAVSEKFEEITGYSQSEIIGKNCRFLNDGCDVDPFTLAGLRLACKTGAPFTSVLTNRRKSGELFLNLLDLRGLVVAQKRQTGEDLWFLIGIQADVTDIADDGVPQHHLPELHQVISLLRSKITDQLAAMAVAAALVADFDLDEGLSEDAWCLLQEPRWKSDAGGAQLNVLTYKNCEETSASHDLPAPIRRCNRHSDDPTPSCRETELVQGSLVELATSFWDPATDTNAAKQYAFDTHAVSALLLGTLAAMGTMLLIKSCQLRSVV